MTTRHFIQKTEHTLEGIFREFPSLPLSWRDAAVNLWPWIALISGISQIAAASSLWHLTRLTELTIHNLSIYQPTIIAGPSALDKVIIYLGLITLVTEGTLLILAFNPLRARLSKGWDLAFLAALINLAYALISIFITERGISSSFGSLFGSAVGFYLLFQIKHYFGPSSIAPSQSTPHTDKPHKK